MENLGKQSCFDVGVKIIKPENIKIASKFSIGSLDFLTADGGEIEIGDEVSLNRNVHLNASISGKITIGNGCLIGPNVVMRTSNHIYLNIEKPIRKQGHTSGDINLEDDVWIGSNVVILSNVRIGKGAIIAAGAVVNKNVPPFSVSGGIPAKVIKYRSDAWKNKS